MAYLSKAPGSLETYRGDGDWFKIGEIGAKNDDKWAISSQNGPVSLSPSLQYRLTSNAR